MDRTIPKKTLFIKQKQDDTMSQMQNRKTIFIIGLVIFFMPILGFPAGFKSFLLVLGGLILMVIAARKTLEKRIIKNKIPRRRKEKNPIFVESGPQEESATSITMNEVSEVNREETV